MTSRPFHHGNLRAVLLDEAETMLRETGVDGLSLRELARQAGVSHGAPRSHFIDKQSLLDALVEQGFERFTKKITVALSHGGSFEDRFRLVGRAYVDFAVQDAALMELMFAAKTAAPVGPAHAASLKLFQLLDDALNESKDSSTDDRDRFKLLFGATMQGAAALIAARRITRAQGERLVDDATDSLLSSQLGLRVVGQG